MRYQVSIICITILTLVLSEQQELWARTADMMQVCSGCHTMHNSQGGGAVVGAGEQESLLSNTCNGCHTAASGITNVSGDRPYVMSVNAPTYGVTGTSEHNTLAGGSFYWVAQGQDKMGHNVEGIIAQTSRTAPGSSRLFDTTNPLTCAGINGCHGDPAVTSPIKSMYQTHHANPALPIDGNSVATSYRFLDGIVGIEDPDYELTVSAAANNHNQYKGYSRGFDGDPDSSSISHHCARCHGDFHNGGAGPGAGVAGFPSPWIRHPVDYDMNDSTGAEYADYGGVGTNQYMVETPVASDSMAGGAKATVLLDSGDAIVTCISCHRAHGSQFESSLRWDYKNWPASGYDGCGNCHTAKN